MPTKPQIVLLHATPIAMAPIQSAFTAGWPEAEVVNLLDDGLTIDPAREADLSPAMIRRFVKFGRYGAGLDAAGFLVTCSAFGPAIDALADSLNIPVLKPNEAMFHAAAAAGSRIGMLATFGPSVPTMTAEFDECVAAVGAPATVVVPDAIDLLRAGNARTHNRLVAEHAPDPMGCDAIMPAHLSTSCAASNVRAVVRTPVFTAPDAAVARMRALVHA